MSHSKLDSHLVLQLCDSLACLVQCRPLLPVEELGHGRQAEAVAVPEDVAVDHRAGLAHHEEVDVVPCEGGAREGCVGAGRLR